MPGRQLLPTPAALLTSEPTMKYAQTMEYAPGPKAEYVSVPSTQELSTPCQVSPLSSTWIPSV